MNETYTRKQAMQRLGIRSTHAFTHLEKKYPEAFVIIKQVTSKHLRYDKATLDKFVVTRFSAIEDPLRTK
jgi:hypothetical protein